MREKLIFYNIITLSFVTTMAAMLLAIAFWIICLILSLSNYSQIFIGLINLSSYFATFLEKIVFLSLFVLVATFSLGAIGENSISNFIFELQQTFDLRHFTKKMTKVKFSKVIRSCYVESKNLAEVTWNIKIPLNVDEAKELKRDLNAIYEFISYNNPNYIFSNFERRENYYILTGTLNE